MKFPRIFSRIWQNVVLQPIAKGLDLLVAFLFRRPFVYRRLQSRIISNPEALFRLLSHKKAIRKLSAQKGLMSNLVKIEKAALHIASAPGFVENIKQHDNDFNLLRALLEDTNVSDGGASIQFDVLAQAVKERAALADPIQLNALILSLLVQYEKCLPKLLEAGSNVSLVDYVDRTAIIDAKLLRDHCTDAVKARLHQKTKALWQTTANMYPDFVERCFAELHGVSRVRSIQNALNALAMTDPEIQNKILSQTKVQQTLCGLLVAHPINVEVFASNPNVKEKVLKTLTGPQIVKETQGGVFRAGRLISALARSASAERLDDFALSLHQGSAASKLKQFMPAAAWRAGIQGMSKQSSPRIRDFWSAVEVDGTVPLFNGRMRIAGLEDFSTISEEVLVHEDYYFGGYNQTAPLRIIDGGSNIGLSISYFKHLYPNATIEAFEPSQTHYDIAQENIAALGLADVTLHRAALAKEEGELELHVNEAYSLAGSIKNRMADKGVETKSAKVASRRLSAFLADPVHFLKLDIEGAETEVFLEAGHLLHNVKYIFCEYHYDNIRSRKGLMTITNILAKSGFVYQLARSGWAEKKYNWRPMSYVGNSYSLSIFARNVKWID